MHLQTGEFAGCRWGRRGRRACRIHQVDWPCLNPVLAALAAGASPPWSAAPSSPPSWTATCSRHGNRHRTHTDTDKVWVSLLFRQARVLLRFDLKTKTNSQHWHRCWPFTRPLRHLSLSRTKWKKNKVLLCAAIPRTCWVTLLTEPCTSQSEMWS